jgi:2'-5' RNA ligase
MTVNNGFNIEIREFKPHLTLGREIVVDDGFDREMFLKNIPKIDVKINKISLMKSEKINGKLTYTEIYKKQLD